MIKGKKIGTGVYGIVYESKSEGNSVAVKRNLIPNTINFCGSIREMDVLATLLGHPYIVPLSSVKIGAPFTNMMTPIRDSSLKDDVLHFVFERGVGDLNHLIRNGRTYWKSLKMMMASIILGIEYAHSKGIVHRDLKPTNIIVYDNNVVKISDFGLAKPHTYQSFMTPQTVTSWYRAPEVALAVSDYDYKSDIWSLGCILFELVSGRSFVGPVSDDPQEIINRILTVLPESIPHKDLVEMCDNGNIEMDIVCNSKAKRVSFPDQMGISSGKSNTKFKREVGHVSEINNLLTKMLSFDWRRRYTATECLNHSFFNSVRIEINDIRAMYPPVPTIRPNISLRSCKEREFMNGIALSIYENRQHYSWYSHRALFTAVDIFNRYINHEFEHTDVGDNVESEERGALLSKSECHIQFIICLYIALKYYMTLTVQVDFGALVGDLTQDVITSSQEFEIRLIFDILKMRIYRETLFETADHFNMRLGSADVRILIYRICNNDQYEGTYYDMFSNLLDNGESVPASQSK